MIDFKQELANLGYNNGNSIDVEILINEILPELLSKQETNRFTEENVRQAWLDSERNMRATFSSSAYKEMAFEQWIQTLIINSL
jgi:hypothetical protein